LKITGVKNTAATDLCLVELQTDAGLSGIAIGPPEVGAATENLVDNILAGADPRAIMSLWQEMSRADARPEAIAAVDTALWDLKAKTNGEPLWKALGGMRPRANAYASVDDWSGEFAQFGFHECKLKLAADPETDLRRLGEIREALSARNREPVLMINARGAWAAADAITNVARMEEEFDLTWVEAPVDETDIQGLKQVSDQVFAAVCAGRHLHRAADYLPYVQSQALDVVQIDILRTGITGALQIADMAYGLELPVTLTASPGNLAAHVAAVMPNFMSIEVVHAGSTTGAITSDVRIEGGRALVGDEPGIGLTIDSGALK